ncbi:hypothetical protein [Burkholderia ambifaria]|uniref:InvB/SpaK family type III secretion system chaperone n=1 Tax=Burkholderia ambifaria TaxID=152480 RepID=UPI001590A4D9|nr:hypothetical protein [Burkholderia ambifaria]
MPIDLPALTRDALHHAGIDPGLIAELDPHAAIELTFRTVPMIRIETWEDDLAQLECALEDLQGAPAPMCAVQLLEIMREEAPWSYTRGVCLLELEERWFLHAVVARSHLGAPEAFAAAIEGFYTRVEKACAAVKAGL